MRLTIDLIASAPQSINPTLDRMISMRGCKISAIENLGATMDHFDCIDLSDNEILKLDNIPPLYRLKTLILCNNRISRIAADAMQYIPNLNSLVLTNNKIENLSDLDPLFVGKNLVRLSIVENPVTSVPYYRLYVIYHLENLRILDFQRIRKAEREQSKLTFSGSKLAEFKAQMASHNSSKSKEETTVGGNQKKVSKPATDNYGEDVEKIKVAIAQASTMEDITRLEKALKLRLPVDAINGGDASMDISIQNIDDGKVEDVEDEDMEE